MQLQVFPIRAQDKLHIFNEQSRLSRFFIHIERLGLECLPNVDAIGTGAGAWRVENWKRLITARTKIGSDRNFRSMESHVRNDRDLAVSGR